MAGRILALEPYYGGSHKNFLDGLAAVWPGGFDLITLPARKWKWRMRLSAPWLAAELAGMLPGATSGYSCLLCSTFVDVATFKGLAPAWARELPVLTYFHENQFVYPVRVEDARDAHFALTNLTTALASDRLAFNSRYNYRTFLEGCTGLLKISSDMDLGDLPSLLDRKTSFINPGIDFTLADSLDREMPEGKKPVVVWNHRWEHDKNPEEFFAAIDRLDQEGVDFHLIVLGESFRECPDVFTEARKRFALRILQFGYAGSREEYIGWLKKGDVVVSTAGHEFYGISIIEAVRAGCRPVLPNRLSYPELFPREFLYEEGGLFGKLKASLALGALSNASARNLTERFSWDVLRERYIEWLSGECYIDTRR
ncbi:MAG: DUF3524 domain-containing protein [Proteobacteria bacterium]|nr:DUF3524 domain-containing protein [Pseudomonadota bacterium]MBU1739860.1 DUF3524 domain-containing protein [Pseudomonadota bacterium]